MNPEPDPDALYRPPTPRTLAQYQQRYGKKFVARAHYLARMVGLRFETTVREMRMGMREPAGKNDP